MPPPEQELFLCHHCKEFVSLPLLQGVCFSATRNEVSPTTTKYSKCEYDTDTVIPKETLLTVKDHVDILKLHREDDHPPAPPTNVVGVPATGTAEVPVTGDKKFPRPEIDQVQTLEVWDTFIADWGEYKRQRGVLASIAPGLLVV